MTKTCQVGWGTEIVMFQTSLDYYYYYYKNMQIINYKIYIYIYVMAYYVVEWLGCLTFFEVGLLI